MAGAENNARAGRRAGHFLCPLESCKEGELCPHAVHMALRMEDGIRRDALNARRGCRQRMERHEPGQQRVENPLATREGYRRLANRLGVSSTRLAPGGEENSSDPAMIGYNHSSHKINQQRYCRASAQELWDPMGSSLPRASAIVK